MVDVLYPLHPKEWCKKHYQNTLSLSNGIMKIVFFQVFCSEMESVFNTRWNAEQMALNDSESDDNETVPDQLEKL